MVWILDLGFGFWVWVLDLGFAAWSFGVAFLT